MPAPINRGEVRRGPSVKGKRVGDTLNPVALELETPATAMLADAILRTYHLDIVLVHQRPHHVKLFRLMLFRSAERQFREFLHRIAFAAC